ncbi:MAG: uroporphyrinogen-III synthase [Ilumatobacteraceae bacterium]
MHSLAGRTIVITRTSEQSIESADLVSSFGAIPVVVPLIETVDEPTGMEALQSLDLSGIDWIVVTSPNGAQRISSLVAADAATPKFAAVGATTAAALARCDLVAAKQSAVGLLEIFPPGPGRVVAVQAVDAAPTLVSGLRDAGWDVVTISPYRTVSASPSDQQRLAALSADAVLLASGSAARAWIEVFGQHAPPVVVAIGEQTAAAAERAGLKISAISADHSVYGMLVCLGRYLQERP